MKTLIPFRQHIDKLEFGGQGPQPMRYGSVGSPVSTGRRSKRDRAILGSERQIPIYRIAGYGWTFLLKNGRLHTEDGHFYD